jgi:hypothetical protein
MRRFRKHFSNDWGMYSIESAVFVIVVPGVSLRLPIDHEKSRFYSHESIEIFHERRFWIASTEFLDLTNKLTIPKRSEANSLCL